MPRTPKTRVCVICEQVYQPKDSDHTGTTCGSDECQLELRYRKGRLVRGAKPDCLLSYYYLAVVVDLTNRWGDTFPAVADTFDRDKRLEAEKFARGLPPQHNPRVVEMSGHRTTVRWESNQGGGDEDGVANPGIRISVHRRLRSHDDGD